MGRLGRQKSQLSVQTRLDGFLKPALLRSKQVQLLSLLLTNKCIVFLQYLNKGSTVIFYLLSSALAYVIKFSIYLCSKFIFVF
jgi:hypothetical protein